MKEHGIKILYGILVVGIIISIIHIINDKNGAGFGNIIDTFTITSLIIFLATIIYILLSFKENIKKISVWFLLLLSCPLSIMSMTHIIKEYSLEMTETTTSQEFLYDVKVESRIYERDKIKIQTLVDSLIKVKAVERTAELALRYFNGKTYNDTIERNWAIDLPTKLDYKKTIVDTLFYPENGKNIIAGLLIIQVFNDFKDCPKGRIYYEGHGFIFNENDFKPIKILVNSVSGYDNYESCSDRLRNFYLKKTDIGKDEFNMNDIRFLNKIK